MKKIIFAAALAALATFGLEAQTTPFTNIAVTGTIIAPGTLNITSPTTNTFQFAPGSSGGTFLWGSASGGVNMLPTLDDASSFGSASFRWGQVYAVGLLAGHGGVEYGATGSGASEGIQMTDGGGHTLTLQGGEIYPPTGGWPAGSVVVMSSGGYLQSTGPGTSGQVLTSNGSLGPTFQNAGSGSGTVTSVATGVGLEGGTITTTGTLSLITPVSVPDGGTGSNSFTSGQVLYGNGTGAILGSVGFTTDGTGDAALSGNLSFSTGSGVVGGVTSSVPNAGVVGYYAGVDLASSSAISLTSGVVVNIVSHTLQAGHWLVFANVWFSQGSGTGVSSYYGATSRSSATLPGTNSPEESATTAQITQNAVDGNLKSGPTVYLLTSPTTIYLVSGANFGGGTLSTYGGMSWIQLP